MKNKVLSIVILLSLSLNGVGQNIYDFKQLKMNNTTHKYGIEGRQAPELDVPVWVDQNGDKSTPIYLKDFENKFKVIYCFQAWCPGCHSQGLPSLQKMTQALQGNENVVFLAIQTVFEGSHANTFERMQEIQKQYNLAIPFGHDVGNEYTRNISSTMFNYRTGGTPWFIFVDENNRVVFNDYHLNTEKAIEYLKTIK